MLPIASKFEARNGARFEKKRKTIIGGLTVTTKRSKKIRKIKKKMITKEKKLR